MRLVMRQRVKACRTTCCRLCKLALVNSDKEITGGEGDTKILSTKLATLLYEKRSSVASWSESCVSFCTLMTSSLN